MTWSPISTRWNTTQICLVFPSFMPLSALLVDQPKLLNTVQHLCDVLIQLTGPPRGEGVSIIPLRLRKSVVPCGGYRWWYEDYWKPLCSDVLFICLRTFRREICQILIILTHKVAVAEIYSAFGPFFWPSLMQIVWCPLSGVPHKNWTLISP